MIWWLWISLALVMIIAEMFLPTGFVLVIIGLAFLGTGILVGLGVTSPIWLQYAICVALLIILLFFFRKKIVQLLGGEPAQGYSDFHNEEVVISSSIAPGQIGQGELRGAQWSVRNTGATALSPGDRCKVLRVNGLVVETSK